MYSGSRLSLILLDANASVAEINFMFEQLTKETTINEFVTWVQSTHPRCIPKFVLILKLEDWLRQQHHKWKGMFNEKSRESRGEISGAN